MEKTPLIIVAASATARVHHCCLEMEKNNNNRMTTLTISVDDLNRKVGWISRSRRPLDPVRLQGEFFVLFFLASIHTHSNS
jgi:hypothetical protein